jgi:hypothetical protein
MGNVAEQRTIKSAELIPTPATFFTCTIPLGFFSGHGQRRMLSR